MLRKRYSARDSRWGQEKDKEEEEEEKEEDEEEPGSSEPSRQSQ